MKFHIMTLGCKVNQYESQALAQLLSSRGHIQVEGNQSPDTIIINTCAVTAESGRKSRQAIRHLKRENPGAVIAVCGCYSQTSPGDIEELGADLISGSGQRIEFADKLEKVCSDGAPIVLLDDPRRRHEFETLPSGSVFGRTRAMLKIQDGCSNFCTYCIIPYARGPVRSMSLEDIHAEAARLHREGFREIVLTGIEISSYGVDLGNGSSLIDAVRAVSQSAPDVRIHLGSLEPRTATEEFCRSLAEIPNICPHFHLSLQSGCDATLRRMGRKYDTSLFLRSASNLRQHFDNCGITTDLITGFPGETEEEFAMTLEFIKKCNFSAMHIFPYSVRPGTPAANMPDQVEKGEKHRRAVQSDAIARQMTEEFLNAQSGKILSVLFETFDGRQWHGHSDNYLEVAVSGENLRGKVSDVQITGRAGTILCGYIPPITV